MTENGALRNSQIPAWQLLAELSATDEPGSGQQFAEPVAELVHGLGLQPAQVKQIQQAVQEAAHKTTQHGNPHQDDFPLAIREWISDVHTPDAHSSGSGAQRDRQRAQRGWGSFLNERHAHSLQTVNILNALIEFAAVSSAFAATSAFLAASFSLLTGEFAGTRLYLFEIALVFTLVACAFCLGIRPLRQRPPGEQ